MKKKQRQLKTAFTITELLVAIALLAALIAGSGVVFQKAIQSERVANATAEITRKLQVVTDQIDRDFSGMLKNGEIVIIWVPGADTDGDDLVNKLRPGIDGVIIKKGYASATFLPQVWSQLPNPENFLLHLCAKAGLPGDCWRTGELEVSTYQVQYFTEKN